MATNEEAQSSRSIALKTVRDKAYLAANTIKAAAFADAVVAAKEDYHKALVAANAVAIAAATAAHVAADAAAAAAAVVAGTTAALAAAAAADVENKALNVQNSATLYTKYVADHAYALADVIYKASIEKADIEYDASRLAE